MKLIAEQFYIKQTSNQINHICCATILHLSNFQNQMQHQEMDAQQVEQKQPAAHNLPQESNNGSIEPQQRMQNGGQAEPNISLGMQPQREQAGVNRNSPESQISNGLDWFLHHPEYFERLNPNQEAVRNGMREDPPPIEEQDSSSNQMEKLFKGKPASKWKRQFGKKKGRFSPEEQKILNQGIRQFLAHYEITHDDFIDMLCGNSFTKSLLSQHDFFKMVSNLLPSRSTYSCYSYIKRNFMKDTKKGPWTIQESAKLLQLVDKYGNKWTTIGEKLDRYPADVSLKYQTLGCKYARKRVKGSWKLSELVKLLKLIDKKLGLQFLNPAIEDLIKEQEAHNMKDHLDRQNRAYNSKEFQHHNDRLVLQHLRPKVRQIPLDLIPWADIGNKMETRSMIDCKNKFLQLLEMALKGYKVKHEGIVNFIQGQAALEECQIDWKKWQGHDMDYQQAKNRFLFMKKLIKNKSDTQFLDQLSEMKKKMENNGMY